MSSLASTLLLVTLLDVLQAAPEKDESPTPEQVRAAVERSLPFLAEGGAAWREGKTPGGQNGRICVTCHQIPFTIWSHNEAARKGIKIDQKKHDDLTDWAFDWCATNKSEKTNKHTGGFLDTMNQMAMGRGDSPLGKTKLEAYALFEPIIGEMQKPEGNWKQGNQISRPGAEREADEVDTMWTILGLTSLEDLKGDLPKASHESLTKNRQKALDWLKTSKPGTRSDWLALRTLVERQFGDAAPSQEWLTQLLAQQNADGGWPLVKGEASHPLVTGQCLYALDIAGRTSDDPAVRRAWKYLLSTQETDGSWKAPSRREATKFNVITIHWGTGWATIGLIRTLPK